MSQNQKERSAVILLYNANKKLREILKILKNSGVNRQFIFRTIKRYKKTGDIKNKSKSGRPRSVRTKSAIKAVRERVRRNPCRKQKVLSRELKIPLRSMSCIIREDLGLKALKKRFDHLLTPALKKIRLTRAKELLPRHGRNGHKSVLFTDEKIFTIEESFNKQNDRVLAKNAKEASKIAPRVQRRHHLALVGCCL